MKIESINNWDYRRKFCNSLIMRISTLKMIVCQGQSRLPALFDFMDLHTWKLESHSLVSNWENCTQRSNWHPFFEKLVQRMSSLNIRNLETPTRSPWEEKHDSENSRTEIKYPNLHNFPSQTLHKRQMRRIFFNVILSILFWIEVGDENVGESALVNISHFIKQSWMGRGELGLNVMWNNLMSSSRERIEMGKERRNTCKPSMELSLPPVKELIYGFWVVGWMQVWRRESISWQTVSLPDWSSSGANSNVTMWTIGAILNKGFTNWLCSS